MAQFTVFATLAVALVLFVWGRWRYDVVALSALLFLVLAGIVPAEQAFTSFGHPAVVAVASILVVSKGLQNSGLVDRIGKVISGTNVGFIGTLSMLCLVVALSSCFMSSVGALAIFIPVAVKLARQNKKSASLYLMPLAFASLLGAMVTLIGSAPNIIVAEFRMRTSETPFQMFDYTPVGGLVAFAAIAFMCAAGWRLIPERRGEESPEELFEIGRYFCELEVTEGSHAVGKTIIEMESEADTDALIAGLIRNGERHMAPMGLERIRAGDVLIVEADPAAITELQQSAQLKLTGEKPLQGGDLESDEIKTAEGVVMHDSVFRGRSIASLRLRSVYGVNLLAVARSGERLQSRLGHNRLRPGDVLLLQGPKQALKHVFTELGCLPLAERGISLARKPQIILATAVFVLAVAASAAGILSVHIAFAAAALAMVFTGLVSLEDAYTSINWPIVVLLGAMIPVGHALETTGGAQLIAEQLKTLGAGLPEPATVGLILLVTMCLSDLVNNAATAVLMCPIVIEVSQSLQVSPDTLLMAVAIGSS